MSEKIPVSIKVSKKIYDHIISYFRKTLLSGNSKSLIFDKYKSDDIRPFIHVSFEDFLKGPQDRESLIELLDELYRLYRNQCYTYASSFTYDMSLFNDDKDKDKDNDKDNDKDDNNDNNKDNLCISNENQSHDIQLTDLSNRLSSLESILDLSKVKDLEKKLKDSEAQSQYLLELLREREKDNKILKDNFKAIAKLIKDSGL